MLGTVAATLWATGFFSNARSGQQAASQEPKLPQSKPSAEPPNESRKVRVFKEKVAHFIDEARAGAKLLTLPLSSLDEARTKSKQITDLYTHLSDVPPEIDSTGEVAKKLNGINTLFGVGELAVKLRTDNAHHGYRDLFNKSHEECKDIADNVRKLADEIESKVGLATDRDLTPVPLSPQAKAPSPPPKGKPERTDADKEGPAPGKQSGPAPSAIQSGRTGAAAYDVFPEPWRSRFVQHWEEEVEATRKSIRGGQAVAKNRTRLAVLERNDPPHFGNHGAQYPLDEWKVGDSGWCRRRPLIIQVLPPDQVLIGEEGGTALVLLKVSSTAGLLAGKPFVLDDVVTLVTGTTTYKTATGGTKTVLTAELVNPASLKKQEVVKLPQPEGDAKAPAQPVPAQPVPAQPVPGQQYGPVPSLVRWGKTGATAYDLFPEPWRARFIKQWEAEVSRAKHLLEAAEQRVRDAEKAYARDQAVQLPNGRRLALDREEIAAAKKAVEDGRESVARLERNDPPYFASKEERQTAEFAALPPAEQKGRLAEQERQRAAEEERKKQKAARVQKLKEGLTEWEQRYVTACERGGASARLRELLVYGRSPLASLRTGDYGRLTFRDGDSDVVVKQVVSGSEMLAYEHRIGDQPDLFWLEGVSTQDIVDGVMISLKDCILMVAGTKTYPTALGTKTVKRLVVVNTKRVNKVLDELGL
jgi:hypothetical protein